MSSIPELSPIGRIFKRLAATYGAAWDRSLGQAPIENVMVAWEHELSGFLQNRRAMLSITWALENLPDRCPNVIEFRSLCRLAPAAPLPILPSPAADPVRMAAELSKLEPVRQAVVSRGVVDPKAWANKLVADAAAGLVVNVGPLRMAHQALGMVA